MHAILGFNAIGSFTSLSFQASLTLEVLKLLLNSRFKGKKGSTFSSRICIRFGRTYANAGGIALQDLLLATALPTVAVLLLQLNYVLCERAEF
ncbi:hypothetical protein K450DRAFT_236717 [Umbelopsis ramanniana AG]|uniref:Uncharacterized protein n=1 Tax=Umbelopsis ramanniana AG TaxID=1314678 RepID=A0AAD5EBJ0_UMBRA|nr:uncharacterized protein K450DRAFT_236717 [Umbelopsis ramanniana AG]KAI8580673.1 hypothetical protein K450DRAFT_236717 [Umbelopsis ramanniana AG]